MSRKPLNIEGITNELRGASLFFSRAVEPTPAENRRVTAPAAPASTLASPVVPTPAARPESPEKPLPASPPASTLAPDEALIVRIRKTVKAPGKEVSFVRLTHEEKQQLADLVYHYKRQGVRTSENEINRIAVNFLLEDYQRHGTASLLVRVMAALLA